MQPRLSPNFLSSSTRVHRTGPLVLQDRDLAAAAAAAITPITIAVFTMWPPPYNEPAAEWFTLLRDNPLLGLMSLDLGFVVVTALIIPLMAALTVALYRVKPAMVLLAGVLSSSALRRSSVLIHRSKCCLSATAT